MSVASTSQAILRGPLRRATQTLTPRSGVPAVQKKSYLHAFANSATASGHSFAGFASSLKRKAASSYSTSAFQQAQPNTIAFQGTKGGGRGDSSSSSQPNSEDGSSEPDPDEPPKKATIRERLRFLSRRYGWWALGVYLLASAVDFSLVFVSIHFLGADHIRDLEDRLRKHIGMGKREMEDHEVAAWPVPAVLGSAGSTDMNAEVTNNEEAARKAAQRVSKQQDVSPIASVKAPSSSSSSSTGSSSTLWTEAVLAYTIHKTLLLPFRVGATAAITPSFVKYMVKLGWASDNAAVQKAAKAAKMARDAAKAKAASSTPK